MPVERPLLLAGNQVFTSLSLDIEAAWDRRVVVRVSQAGPIEAALAADAAARVFPVTRALPGHRRASILLDAAVTLASRHDELVGILRDEAGKPVALARGEVERAVATLTRYADEARRLDVSVAPGPGPGGRLALSRSVPRGPVLALTPFNFPLRTVCQKIGPAVATGCPIVVRPAPQTPSAALVVGEVLLAAGWPADGLSVLPCDDAITDRLIADARFATLSYTGCARTGWRVRARAGRRIVLVDPGAHATVILEPDADLDAAVPRLVRGTYAHAGQICAAAQRILVHRSIYEDVRARFVAEAAALGRGDPGRDDVVCGPMIDLAGTERVEAWMERAEQLGARRLAGGDREATVLTPAVFEAEDPFVQLAGEEPLGPVAVLEPYPSLDAAVDRVNQQQSGGETCLFTRTVRKVWQVFEQLDSGSLVHDEHPNLLAERPGADGGDPRAGLGPRDLDDLTERRTLMLSFP